jgi:O-antigen ligase
MTATDLQTPGGKETGLGSLHFAFLLVLGLSAVPLGGNRVFAMAVVAALLVSLFFMELTRGVVAGTHPLRRLRPAWPVFVALGLFLGLLWWQAAVPVGPGSADAHSTWQHLLLSLGFFAAFGLVMLQVRPGAPLRRFVAALVLLGLMQAVLAIYLYSSKAEYEFLHFALDHGTRTFGTFSYHNSLANYLVVCLCLGVGLLVANLRGPTQEPRGWRVWLSHALQVLFSGVVRLRVMLLVMVVALVLTRSRMGNAAFLLALFCVAVPVLLLKGRLRLRGLLLLGSIVLLDVLFVGQLVGFDEVAQRLNRTAIDTVAGETEESLEDRSAPAQLALTMVAERPWLGRGAGTFYTTFPQYASPQARLYYDHAHNDYVQLAVEVGLIGVALLASAVVFSVVRAVQVLRRPLTSSDMGMALGVLMAVFAVLVQAFVDFHFQLPANALLFVVVLAIPWLLRRHPQPHH